MPPRMTPSKETPGKGPKKESTNFRTFEAQSRLVAALLASLDNPRLDYKKIAQYLGGSATESSVEHRFRPVKIQATLVKKLAEKQIDPATKEIWKCTKKDEIATFFGGSTPDGMGFQFRTIKKGAEALKGAVSRGESPVEAFNAHLNGSSNAAGSVPATPAKRARSTKGTPGSGATPASKRSKRSEKIKIEPMSEDEDEDSPEGDFSGLDKTPSPTLLRVLDKANDLLHHSAWAKPADKTKSARPRPASVAPATPRQAAPAPSYTLAPIPGLSVSQAEQPNGYTDPATGYAYAVAPRAAAGSTSSTAANSPPAMDVAGMRRGSTISIGSNTDASNPATPTNNTTTAPGMDSMDMSFYVPGPSTSEANTPKTTTSSNNITTTSGMHADMEMGDGATSFAKESFPPLTTGFGASASHKSNSNGNGNSKPNGRRAGYSAYSVDQQDISLAAEVNFGGFEAEMGDGEEEEEEWDAGDV
ncbi:hypothetical protein N658DRAFT_504783 [Parathielavia hyrcaniae]|uniref:Uncharacterized protein n=1 Tax=Parathielavia hyrcaniae TaxID=113614 RepID=A0AAN6QB40_9PEZI|nr:hypothetical protein N658DRAFT_504783 [Parathielavia hyrcaniae]